MSYRVEAIFRFFRCLALISPAICMFLVSSPQSAAGSEIHFTDEEKAYIASLRQKGGLKIATRISEHIYAPQDDGSIQGFYYHIIRAFADEVGIRLRFRVVSWSDYFALDGKFPKEVRTHPDFTYTPDLIRSVDMYMDAFTRYPWREKLFTAVDFFPIRTMAVTRKGEELHSIRDLTGKTIALVPDSTYADTLKSIEKDLKAEFSFLPVKSFQDGLEAVQRGDADVTCMDSHDAWINRYSNLTMSLPLTDIQQICWMLRKEHAQLAAIIAKYIRHAKETGLFEDHWKTNYKIPFDRYLKLIYGPVHPSSGIQGPPL